MNRCDFIEDRYATDCGPVCRKCDNGMQGMYVYLNTNECWYDNRSWRFHGQCATCHDMFDFPVPITYATERDVTMETVPTIHQVKDAHFNHVARK